MSEDKNIKETMQYLEERASNITRYSDKLSEKIKEVDQLLEGPAGKAGVEYTDNTSYYSDELGGSEYLGIRKIRGAWGLVSVYDGYGFDWQWIVECSRKCKKAAAKRLPEFLKGYANYLEKTAVDYQAASEMAENIAKAIV